MMQRIAITDGATALVLSLPVQGMPEIVAFGPEAAMAVQETGRSSRTNGMDIAAPSAVLLPTGGMGFFGWPAIAGHRDGRNFVIVFTGWSATCEAGTCALHAADEVARLGITIRLAISGGVLTSSVALTNAGDTPFTLDRCMAGSMVVPDGAADVQYFAGMWGREFQIRREALGQGIWLRENRRGRTSHDRPPSLVIETATANLAVHLGWSGNAVLAVDVLDDGRRLVHAGELFEPGEMRLAPSATYDSPTACFAADPALLRQFVRAAVVWPGGTMRPRPVTLNTWEGVYFNHHLPDLMAQVRAAAELGVERFVVDDGWFGLRDDDTTSLGDWQVDTRKYPDGLRPLAEYVRQHGMEFGLWFEPEMVNPDSALYRAHPGWALQVEGLPLLLSRHQLVLDLTRPEVSDYLFACIDRTLRDVPISYVKWDMNRDLTHAAGASGQAATARQTRAVYALMDRVRAAHPDVEIESCASGGGRADYGVLARTHRIWTSDCTDALDRLEIQRGARLFYPPEILGAHVSGSPNHQTHRRHSLTFRAVVALAYHFGIEMDPRTLDAEEFAALKGWVALHKRLRPVLHEADGQFHLDPIDGRYVWGSATPDVIVLCIAQGPTMLAEQPPPLRLPATLVADGRWRIAGCFPEAPDFVRVSDSQQQMLRGGMPFPAATLTAAGLRLPMLRPQSGVVLELHRIAGD